MTFMNDSENRRAVYRAGLEKIRAKLTELDLVNAEVYRLNEQVEAAYAKHRELVLPHNETYREYIRATDAARQKATELTGIRSDIQRLQMELLNLSIEEMGDGE